MGTTKGIMSHNNQASIYLDLARALAAIEVMTYHIRPTILVSHTDIRGHSLPAMFDMLLYGVTDKGFQAVMVFFVLSGFFISSSVFNSISKGTWSWGAYLNNRLTRLWLVLIPALILTFAWNELSLALFHGRALVGNMKFTTFIGNVFFLQGVPSVGSPSFGGNAALWSLSYEFWYYVLFPCIVLAFASRKVVSKVVYACITVLLSLFLGKAVMLYFLVWLIGSSVALMPKLSLPLVRHPKIILLSAFLLFMIALGISKREHVYWSDLSIGSTFGLFTYVIISFYNDRSVFQRPYARLCHALAGFSYTLYLVHFPINNIVSSYLNGRKFQPGMASIAVLFMIFFFTVLFAWGVSLVTEAHTSTIRSYTARLLARVVRPFRQSTLTVPKT